MCRVKAGSVGLRVFDSRPLPHSEMAALLLLQADQNMI